MKKILYTFLILILSWNQSYTQEPVLVTDLGNVWINRGDIRRGPYGYKFYHTDTVYHYIDSIPYTYIEGKSGYEERGYIRYDSIAGILYGRKVDIPNALFGYNQIYDTSGTQIMTDEFILMKKDLNIGDTLKLNYSLRPFLDVGYIQINTLIVRNIINLKPPYNGYLAAFNETIDSIENYELEYINIKDTAAVTWGQKIEFNFISGFSTGPFGNLGYNGMHVQPLLSCFWNPTYSDTSISDCVGFIKQIILSDNPVKYESIVLYPNPVSEYIQIKGDGIDFSNQHSIIIYNAIGQQITQTILQDKNDKISTKDLSTGLYYINLIKNGTVIGSSKFIKQ